MIRYGTRAGRWVVAGAVLGSSVVMLDATVVNIALPVMGREMGASFESFQWVLNGYLLTLSSLILLGGSLGDRYGRRRMFVTGTVWFAAASLLCGIAPNMLVLTIARALQGVGGALLTPASLAIIQTAFEADDRPRAIGTWSGFAGVAGAVGPFVGGWLIDAVSWRAVFLLNVPVAAVVIAIAVRHVPETRDLSAGRARPDLPGALTVALGLAGITYALIEGPGRGGTDPRVVAALAVALTSVAAFVLIERTRRDPMLPLDVFRSRTFTATNAVTFVVYFALGGTFFLLPLTLQRALGYSPLEGGVASMPITFLMLVLSPRAGKLAQRVGPRVPLTAGPVLVAAGMLLMRRIDVGAGYTTDVLPAILVFGLGLGLMVAPLTSTVLASVGAEHAGLGSGVNNAVARVAGLLAVAALPPLVGLTGVVGRTALTSGFRTAVTLCALAAGAGAFVAWAALRDVDHDAPALAAEYHCGIDGPPLRPGDPRWGCREAA